jgi:hypothetical protein
MDYDRPLTCRSPASPLFVRQLTDQVKWASWNIFYAADERGLNADDFSLWIPIRDPPCQSMADFLLYSPK